MQPHPTTDLPSGELPFMGEVKAGFPSPAEDLREKLDLVKLLVRHSASTFFFRIDAIHRSYGRESLLLGTQGDGHIRMARDHQSPHYTTLWEDIPRVKVK